MFKGKSGTLIPFSAKSRIITPEKHHCAVRKGREMANPFVHVELVTNDVVEARKFYTALFDWKLEEIPGMDYTVIKVGEGTGGGMMKNPMPDSPSFWLAYVLVADAVAATGKARSLGATICKEVTEIPGIGWFSVITDPTGATLALWQMNPDYPRPEA